MAGTRRRETAVRAGWPYQVLNANADPDDADEQCANADRDTGHRQPVATLTGLLDLVQGEHPEDDADDGAGAENEADQ